VENDHGTGPIATSASPASSANQNEFLPSGIARGEFHPAALEIAQGDWPLPSLDELGDEGAASEIYAEFRRRLRGLRYLRRGERAQALRAAREFRFLSLKALREKRACERRARYLRWRHAQPPPRPLG
jgi:hypothetical protein